MTAISRYVHRPPRPKQAYRSAGRFVRALVAAALTLVTTAALILVSSVTASAATEAVGYFEDGGLTILGGMDPGNGDIAYCINVGASSPIGGATTDQGVVGSVNGLDPATMAKLNMVVSTWGRPTQGGTAANNQASATALAVWSIADGAAFEAEGGVGYKISVAPASERQAIRDLYAQIMADANAYTAPSDVSANVTLTVDTSNHYVGTVNVQVSPGDAAGTITLVNGVFDGNGSSTAQVAGSQTLAVHGVPPTDDGAPYKISGHYAFNGTSGYGPSARLYTTPGSQSIAAAGNPASSRIEGDFSDPNNRIVAFRPVTTTQVTQTFVSTGDPLEDLLHPATAADASGLNNPWYRSPSTGNWAPITFNGTVYGPFSEKPTESASVPAGAPVAGTATVTTTTADGPTVGYTATADKKAPAAGYYTWVWTVKASDQTAGVQKVLPQGYSWSDRFGQTIETTFALPSVTSQARTDLIMGIDKTADTVTVDGPVPAGATVSSQLYNTGPDGTPLCTPDTLVHTSEEVPVTGPGDYTVEGPIATGNGGWVETLRDADGTVLHRGECGEPGEQFTVKQLVVTTTATPEVYTGQIAVDTATITGTIKPGDVLTFVAYQQTGDAPADTDPIVCDLSNQPIALTPGVVTDQIVKSGDCTFTTAGVFYWQESVTNQPTGTIVHRGERGAANEWTVVKPVGVTTANLASTGATPAPLLWIGGGALAAGILAVGLLLTLQAKKRRSEAITETGELAD